jgi:zinc-ribbon domain
MMTQCPRCGAPLAPGNPICGNCGLDLRLTWSPAPKPRNAALPIAIGLIAVACLVTAAGLFFVVSDGHGSAGTASPSAEPSVVGEPSSETPSPTASTRPTVNPSPFALRSGTPEPAPDIPWVSFDSPDGKWSARFPSAAPVAVTTPLHAGSYSFSAKYYYGQAGFTGYSVSTADLDASFVSSTDPESLLTVMQGSIGMDGQDVVSGTATESRHNCRDLREPGKIARIWFVGSRFYALRVDYRPGDAVYPDYFFANFKLK